MSKFKLEDFTHYKDFPNVSKIDNNTKQAWIDVIVEEYKKFLTFDRSENFHFCITSGDSYITGEGNNYRLNIKITKISDTITIHASDLPIIPNKKE